MCFYKTLNWQISFFVNSVSDKFYLVINWCVKKLNTCKTFLCSTDSFMSLQITNLKNYLKQWSHVKHFSLVWILLCLFKSPTWKKYLKQWSHVKHFSPVRILLCLFKSQTWKNYMKQWSHVKWFFPVRILLCLFKSQTWKNYLKQWLHVKHFSSVQILLCLFKLPTWILTGKNHFTCDQCFM